MKGFKVILQIYADLNILNRPIDKISDIVMMGKQNILSHVISTQEYNVTVETLSFLKTNVLFFRKIFVLQIPRFVTETYFRVLIIPFPNDPQEELDSAKNRGLLYNSVRK